MNRILLIRAAGLYLPLTLTVALWLWRKPDRRGRAAALLACAWNLLALLVLHVGAGRLGWWRFDAVGGLFLGIPVDLYLGWALLWGPAAALAFPRLPLAGVLAVCAALDGVLMPAARPVVVLGDSWLVGEAVGLLVALLPAQLLARWTSRRRHLAGRATLQVVLFGGLFLGVLPAIVLQRTGGLPPFFNRSGWMLSLSLQLMVVAAIPGLSAVQEFCERGLGTPLPYDPPRRLVTSGVYAYVANPMQISMSLVLIVAGLVLGNVWVAAGGLMACVYGAGLAAWHEDAETADRFGQAWLDYRRRVRRWLPHFRPRVGAPARLFVAETCGPCSEVAAWLRRRQPRGLAILAAEDHPTRDLTRITYEAEDGGTDEGVAAFGRALEHIHLGWAFVGWTSRLPLVRPFLQAVLDISGAGPRAVARRCARPEPLASGGDPS